MTNTNGATLTLDARGLEPPQPLVVLPEGAEMRACSQSLQSSIDTAFARNFIYRLLATAYEDPEPDGGHWLSSQPIKSAPWSAVQPLARTAPAGFARAAAETVNRLALDAFDDFHYTYATPASVTQCAAIAQ